MTVLLEAVGLTKSFGSNAALRGADLTVQAGEIVAVLGPSGSGKSTLLHCVAGILPVDAGSLNYRGHSLTTMPDRERSALRRNDFGFIFQFGQLVGELTCRENLALPLRLGGAARRPANTAADDWLERLGVAEVADHRPGEISGGQAQRVAAGRAMIGEPRVIFADEPTGALDSLHGERVLTLLLEAVRNTGAAMVLVTHEARVAAYSDREVMVRDGRTAEAAAA
jgi:putative ABC transport system ATP-binding protein